VELLDLAKRWKLR